MSFTGLMHDVRVRWRARARRIWRAPHVRAAGAFTLCMLVFTVAVAAASDFGADMAMRGLAALWSGPPKYIMSVMLGLACLLFLSDIIRAIVDQRRKITGSGKQD